MTALHTCISNWNDKPNRLISLSCPDRQRSQMARIFEVLRGLRLLPLNSDFDSYGTKFADGFRSLKPLAAKLLFGSIEHQLGDK